MEFPKLENIVKVYKGKPNSCMCGCAGTYYYAKAHQEFGSRERGYKVDDEEVNDGVVKRVLNKVAKEGDRARTIGSDIWDVVIGKTQYTIYSK
jgi:hypothetical protein